MPNKTNISKVLAALLTAAVMSLGFAATASAGEFTGTGSITILESLAVSEENPVEFGYIHRPSAGTNMLTLSYSDGSVSTSGTGDAQYVDGTSASGVYLIQGAPEQAIQVDVSIIDFTDMGITIEEAHVNGPTSSTSGNLDDAGFFRAFIGGTVSIGADATLGTHTTDVVVTAAYE